MYNLNNIRKQSEQHQNQQSQRPSFLRFLITALIVWFIFTYFFNPFGDEAKVKVSYTKFMDFIESGNVEEITFSGHEINGKFKNPFLKVSDTNDSTHYEYFKTIMPPIEDSQLLDLLEEQQISVKAKIEDNSWWQVFLISFLPLLLIVGFFLYMSGKMKGNMPQRLGGGLFGVGRSKAKKYKKNEESISYKDVAGLENAKKDLSEIVHYLKMPEKFASLGAEIPKGILLMGPPGTGKTLLARATAGEANVSFFNISGSEFIEMFVGVGASRVRDMFRNAKDEAPSIIFIDEIDSIGRARGTGLGGGHDEREQTLNQILSEMDGFDPHQSVVVIAATNRPDVLDSALTRPGRFDRQITLDLPHKLARKEILKIHTRNVPLHPDINFENLASRTVGFSGADIKNLVNEAALLAGRRNNNDVREEDFDNARDKILLGAEREDKIDENEKKIIAVHEAGHALVARLIPDSDPLQKVTIIPRGRSLGVTEQLPENERHNLSKNYLLDRIAVMLGGRVAEKVVFDEISNGAASDLKQITTLTRRMVCQWGMSNKLGPVYFQKGEEHLFLGREISQDKDFSEYTAQLIDEEIQNIIQKSEQRTTNLIKDNRQILDRISEELLINETLDKEAIDQIFEKI
jgi:cell division protease FtsH